MNRDEYFDWCILLLCFWGFIMELIITSIADFTVCILGCLGIFYCIYYLFVFCSPIKRDWILAKGNFLIKVANFVLLIPFVITFVFTILGNFSPKNLVFDENLYIYNNMDTLGVVNHDTSRNSFYLKAHNLEAINDTIIVRRNKISDCEIRTQEDPSLFWTIYYHFIDPGNQHMTTSETGRKGAALIAILGFLLLNGLLVSTLISWFDRRRDQWIKGEIDYKYFKRWWRCRKHYIVIGGSDVVVGVVEQLLRKYPYAYVLIQTSSDVDTLRRKLFSTISERQQAQIVIYYGSCTSEEDLLRLGLNNAEEVYLIGEDTRSDDVESYHDTLNMKCLELLRKLYMQTANGKEITAKASDVNKFKERLKELEKEDQSERKEKEFRENAENAELELRWKSRPRLNCRVMFEYQTTFSVFQFFDIDEQMSTYINFKPFNYYEMWAQKVLVNREVEKDIIEANFNKLGYLPLEGSEGITYGSDNYVHFFVVGMSRMGVAMGLEAAHLAHFPNYTEQNKIRTKITFIDTNAASEKDFFIGRFRDLFSLSHWRCANIDENGKLQWKSQDIHTPTGYDYLGGDFLDVEWEFINGGIEQDAIQDYILSCTSSKARVTIAICLPESNKAHAAALYLDKRIYESDRLLQVLVYNRNGSAIIDAISKNNMRYPYHGKLRSFGCAADCMAIDHVEISEYIGEQIDKAYNGDKEGNAIEKEKYIGKSKEAMRWSSIYNGNTMWTKLRSIGFNPNEPVINEKSIQVLADVEHNRWNIEELLMNFRPLTPLEQDDVTAQRIAKEKKVGNGTFGFMFQ